MRRISTVDCDHFTRTGGCQCEALRERWSTEAWEPRKCYGCRSRECTPKLHGRRPTRLPEVDLPEEATWIPELDETELLYCHFNPAGYRSTAANVFRWWNSLGPLQRITRGLHLVFREVEPVLPNAARVSATDGQAYFIKEALINSLVSQSTRRFVAWVDADICFPSSRWLMHGLRLLRHYDAVQLFERIDYPDAEGHLRSSKLARAAAWMQDPRSYSGAPGGAWLMRRESFNALGGLPTLHLTGGGDAVAFAAWTQESQPLCWPVMSPAARAAWRAYRDRCRSVIHRIAYSPHPGTHLWHGEQGERYRDRMGIVSRLDPDRDLRVAVNGLPEIITPELRESVRAYMFRRNEDGHPVPDTAYWSRRKDYRYWRTALRFATELAPQARTMLDVGGGVTAGCRYLELLPHFERTSIETPDSARRSLEGVRVILEQFEGWESDQRYDVVLCFQVLEHIRDTEGFARKLFSVARQAVVISIPHRWREHGQNQTHCHGDLTASHLQRWTGRSPDRVEIVEDRPGQARLVAAYAIQ